MKDPEIIHKILFCPYGPEQGPSFQLLVYDIDQNQQIPYRQPGKYMLAYRLNQTLPVPEHWLASDMDPDVEKCLFAGMDFGVPPQDDILSATPVKFLMEFLCLRPGDMPDEFFDQYNEDQLDFARNHAEAVRAEVDVWFESKPKPVNIVDQNGNPIRSNK